MKNLKSRTISLSAFIVSLFLLAAGQSAQAANATWTGSNGTLWSDTLNWSASPVPGTTSTDIATFNNAGNSNVTINLGGTTTIRNILFDTTSAVAYTIGSGGAGSQTLGMSVNGQITVNSTVNTSQLINAKILIGANAAATNTLTNNSINGTLTLAGNVTGGASGNATVAIKGLGNTVVSGIIASGSGSTVSLSKTDSGTLTLSGANTYNGTTTITGGTLQIGNGGSTGSLSTSSAITNNGTLAFSRNNTITQGTDFASIIAGSGNVTQSGTGTLVLSGANTYNGTTRVSSGTLSATGATSLTNSGTLIVDGGSAASAKLSVGSAADFTNMTVNITTADGGVYQKDFLTSEAYTRYGAAKSSFTGGNPDTTASLLAGTTSGTKSVVTSFSSTTLAAVSNDGARISDVFSLNGTGSDIFALQLSGSGILAGNALGWNNSGTWTLATVGNTGAGALAGNYAMSFSAFVLANGGSFNGTTMLGAYGVDTTSGSVWAVINHNSEFAIIPEPSTWALLAFSLTTVMVLRRRRRA